MDECTEVSDLYFYQDDFTTATDWEIFIARVEQIIHEWRLPKIKKGPKLKKGDLSKGKWEKTLECVSFAGTEFNLTRYKLEFDPTENVVNPFEEESEEENSQALEDIMSSENDFPPQFEYDFEDSITLPHPLVRWYGLRDFLVLTPKRESVILESKIKILLSSVYIAVNNCNSQVPIFVQVLEPKQHFYMGVCEVKGIRTDFEMIHLKHTPSHCKYLTGLLNLFKTKISNFKDKNLLPKPVSLAVRFTYILQGLTSNHIWTQNPPDFDYMQGEILGVDKLGKLPFGATATSISELHLFATWPQLMEDVVVDSESYSDFEPSQAPQWSVHVKMSTKQPSCLLSEYLKKLISLCNNNYSMQDLLGGLIDQSYLMGTNYSASLNLLTESRVPTISKLISQAKGPQQISGNSKGPIVDSQLMPILYFLFPDAESKPESPYPEVIGNYSNCDNQQIEELSNHLKSAPMDGLVWRLAIVMSQVAHTCDGIKQAAHLWYEFTQEMRSRWEKGILIPGVAPGFPDQRTCLLHQKLQMLNCCMERKKSREHITRNESLEAEELESDSDDEFFDCLDELDEGSKDELARRSSKHRHKHSLWNQPVGRLSRHGNLRLISTGEHLYIPVTQDPSPKTEDQIEEDSEVLQQLGTDAQGAEMRARMMSASLLSDMESFKAANPGAVLEDFIRWYSPRDWIEEEGLDEYGQKKGSLSSRMQIKGNMWLDVWEAAKPVPARRQKRLFDDTREAEKVLHFLESQKLSSVAKLLMPALIHAAICRLLEEKMDDLPILLEVMQRIRKMAERLTRNPRATQKQYRELADDILGCEVVIAQAKSLEEIFISSSGPPQSEELCTFLSNLMNLPEVDVPGGPRGAIGSIIHKKFSETQKVAQMRSSYENMTTPEGPDEISRSDNISTFPQPSTREFIMRTMAPRPAPYSSITPQRLYAVLRKKEFRLAGCFSQDTTFQ